MDKADKELIPHIKHEIAQKTPNLIIVLVKQIQNRAEK